MRARDREIRQPFVPLAGNGDGRAVADRQQGGGVVVIEMDGRHRLVAAVECDPQQRARRIDGIDDASAPQCVGGGEWFAPRVVAREPDDVEDVQQIGMDVHVAEVILADEVYGRRGSAEGGRIDGRRARARRPRGFEVVVDGVAIRSRQLEGEASRDRIERQRSQAALHGIAVGPVEERERAVALVDGAGADAAADENRDAVEARVFERRRLEDRPRVVAAAVEIFAGLQRAVPELRAAMHAGWNDRLRQPVVADDPWREHCAGAEQQHGRVDDIAADRLFPDCVGGEHSGNEDEIRAELRHDARYDAGKREPRAARRFVAAFDCRHEDENRREEQHGADRVGRLCRRVHRVEREGAEQQRGYRRRRAIGPAARGCEQQQRRDGIEGNLHEQWNPRPIAEQAIEAGEKVRVSPRHFHRRERLSGREGQRQLVVMVESVPAPGMRRADKDEEQPNRQRQQAGGPHCASHLRAFYR